MGKLFSGKKERLQMCPEWRPSVGETRGANQKRGMLSDGSEVSICLSPIGPKLEVGAKIGEAVSCYSSPGHLGPNVPWVTVWFSGLVTRYSVLTSCRW